MRIRFIGYGEAGQSFSESLGKLNGVEMSAYDILFESQGLEGDIATKARARGVTVAPNPTADLAAIDWIILAVTAASSLEAARSVLAALGPEHTVIDINSVSPARKRMTAQEVEATGASYLDMAVMSPVRPRDHRSPVLIAGATAARIAADLVKLEFNFDTVSASAGEATAIKMVRSVFVKGLEALTVQALMAAERAGCYDTILNSLSSSYSGLGWPDFAGYQFERMRTHGKRRAAEMRESARTMEELGFDGDLVRAVAELHQKLGDLGPLSDKGLDQAVQSTSAGLAAAK